MLALNNPRATATVGQTGRVEGPASPAMSQHQHLSPPMTEEYTSRDLDVSCDGQTQSL